MKNKILTAVIILAAGSFCLSCDSLLKPEDDSHRDGSSILEDPSFSDGLLFTAYLQIPFNDGTADRRNGYTEMATDDAVSSNRANAFLRAATGEWTSQYSNNYLTVWDRCIRGIIYANKFLTVIDVVPWKTSSPETHEAYKRRFKGESYAVRAILKFHLLQSVGGYADNGELLGFPDYDSLVGDESETAADFNKPRMSFASSLESIYRDIDKALEYLPMDYINVSSMADLPAGFEIFVKDNDFSAYNKVFGDESIQRISGRIAKAYKAKAALLAASPAFNPDNNKALWENAASIAGSLLKDFGGTDNIDPNGHRWFTASYVDAISMTNDRREMIWRRPRTTIRDWEVDNYPPIQYGSGLVNPTQNLVDVFPMKNGYPISRTESMYDPKNPYADRDPRLDLYIVHDGSKINGQVVNTGEGGKQNAKDSIPTSTRTGYYLLKTLRDDINVSSTANQTRNHYVVNMRFTELFLIYAEAANEAWGPDGDNGYGLTPRSVIEALRKRAGIDSPDLYLNSLTTVEEFRTLIRNERRIELSFEGFRFWDIRRWKLDLSETAKGINISLDKTRYEIVDVEPRRYDNSYMHYGPIPYAETVKYNNIIQNKGWN
jgi:hypothetical protein